MDSKVVAREIKQEIWPLLRRERFTEFSPKTAWRLTSDQIHVVNYQSFNSYLAQGVGCTTFSFALNLGIVFRAIPFQYPVKKGPDPSVKPQKYADDRQIGGARRVEHVGHGRSRRRDVSAG